MICVVFRKSTNENWNFELDFCKACKRYFDFVPQNVTNPSRRREIPEKSNGLKLIEKLMAKSLPVMHRLNLKKEEICKSNKLTSQIHIPISRLLPIETILKYDFRPVKYDRKLMEDTVEAVKRVTEIRKKREGPCSMTLP